MTETMLSYAASSPFAPVSAQLGLTFRVIGPWPGMRYDCPCSRWKGHPRPRFALPRAVQAGARWTVRAARQVAAAVAIGAVSTAILTWLARLW